MGEYCEWFAKCLIKCLFFFCCFFFYGEGELLLLQVDDVAAVGISLERFERVFDLMQEGNRAFRDNRVEEVSGVK